MSCFRNSQKASPDESGGKSGKVREFDIGPGKVGEIRKSRGHCGSTVMCYRSCDNHQINVTRVLLSKVDIQKIDCQ